MLKSRKLKSLKAMDIFHVKIIRCWVFIATALLTLASCTPNHRSGFSDGEIKTVGAMRDVMHKGELFGKISLDTIANKKHLYGIGPLAYLKGEVLIADGKSYVATVGADGVCTVKETFHVESPFFVYANVHTWNELALPDSVRTMQHLESYLDEAAHHESQPFAFTMKAVVESATFHIVNLPEGAEVHSPEDAHRNQKDFTVTNASVELVGFFSRKHQGVFTHHDSFVHIHVITADKTMMGHLEEMLLRKGSGKLFVPSKL